MSTIFVRDIKPRIENVNQRNQSAWFSIVRRNSCQETYPPPTHAGFMYELNGISDFVFSFLNIRSLRYNYFPSYSSTFMKIYLAFNVYSEYKKELEIRPNSRVDFIGISNTESTYWEARFHGRCVLYLSRNDFSSLEITSGEQFWDNIINIYDSLPYKHGIENPYFLINSIRNTPRTPRTNPSIIIDTSNVPRINSRFDFTIDNPNSEIALEYLNRSQESEEEITNRQLLFFVF